MKYLPLLCLLWATSAAYAQNPIPKIYVNFTTHNEMQNENYDTDSSYFAQRVNQLQLTADLLLSKNVKWNYQTCSKFVLGVLKYQQGATNPNDILQWLSNSPNITVDPRPKKQAPLYNYNIADVVHLLDSVGVPDSKTVGGFIYFPYNLQDWSLYENPVPGAVFPVTWQPDIIWGGGSIPPHTHDSNNFGIWKPAGATDSVAYYSHDPAKHLWLVGNGCAYLVDNSVEVQTVISEIRTLSNQIQSGALPADHFYALSITFNQRDLSDGLRQKLAILCDSVNVMVGEGRMQWATIQEKLQIFQGWSAQTGHAYSQWACGEVASTAISTPENQNFQLQIVPNPAQDQLRVEFQSADGTNFQSVEIINLSGGIIQTSEQPEVQLNTLPVGVYLARVRTSAGNTLTRLFVKTD